MKRYKAALIDMDGTLFNTAKGITKAVREACDEYGLKQLSDSEIEEFIGPPIQITFGKKYSLGEDEANKVANIFRRIYKEKEYVLECELYPGMRETLEKLRENGVKLCIASLKKEDMVKKICAHFGISELFDSLHGTDPLDKLSKSDIIKICMDDTGITGMKDAVMIGDSKYDAIGAEEAGCAFLGVTYGFGFHTDEDVYQYDAVGAAHSAAEIVKFI